MKHLTLLTGYALLMWNGSCSCSPPITAEQIERDMIDRAVSVKPSAGSKLETWDFRKQDETTITIAEIGCGWDRATITIEVKTWAANAPVVAFASGRLRLGYERVGGEWLIREVENESFKIDEIVISHYPPPAP